MFNSVLSTWGIVSNLTSILLAFCSVVLNSLAARTGPVEWKNLRVAQATLSVLYVFGFAWLLFTDIGQGEWSEYMTGLSPLAFILMWNLPPILSMKIWSQMIKTIVDSKDAKGDT